MNKEVFLKQLRNRLARLPREEAERLLEFYGELIDDKVENGETELQAVANLGTMEEIIEEIRSENREAFARAEQSGGNLKNGFGARLALAICASSVWLPLYISVWAVLVSLYASGAACVISGVAYILPSVFIMGQSVPAGFFLIGISLICAGLGILLFMGTHLLTKKFLVFTRFLWLGIRDSFHKGGGSI